MDYGELILFNLNTYNDGPLVTWTNVYDISKGYIPTGSDYSSLDNYIKFNIASPPKSTRDVSFPRGSTVNNGIYFRTTLDVSYSSLRGPDKNVLFVNGSFI